MSFARSLVAMHDEEEEAVVSCAALLHTKHATYNGSSAPPPPFASAFLLCCVCVYLAFSSFAFFFEDPKSVLKMAESAPQSTFGARYIQIVGFGRNNLRSFQAKLL